MPRAKNRAAKVAAEFAPSERSSIPIDVQGSYTGVPMDGGRPIQDADDL